MFFLLFALSFFICCVASPPYAYKKKWEQLRICATKKAKKAKKKIIDNKMKPRKQIVNIIILTIRTKVSKNARILNKIL